MKNYNSTCATNLLFSYYWLTMKWWSIQTAENWAKLYPNMLQKIPKHSLSDFGQVEKKRAKHILNWVSHENVEIVTLKIFLSKKYNLRTCDSAYNATVGLLTFGFLFGLCMLQNIPMH